MGTGFGFLIGSYTQSEADKAEAQRKMDDRAATILLDDSRQPDPNFNAKDKAKGLSEELEAASKIHDSKKLQDTRERISKGLSQMTPGELKSVLDEMPKPRDGVKYPHLMPMEEKGNLYFKLGPDGKHLAGIHWLGMPQLKWNSQDEAARLKSQICSPDSAMQKKAQEKLMELTPGQVAQIMSKSDLRCGK